MTRRFLAGLLEVIEIALIAACAVYVVRHFLVQPFLVSGDSMVPNFHNGDYLLVDELTYRLRTPERGEVMVFRNPTDETVFFIKRVIGLPGERIVMNDGKVTVYNADHRDGIELDEAYLESDIAAADHTKNIDVTLGADQYYMLGDNRPYSFDSRRWGPLPKKDIVGRALVRLWPVANAKVFEAPSF